MTDVTYEISEEQYKKAQEEGADSLIPQAIAMGYGAYGANVYEEKGKYYLTYWRGSSCD